MTKQSLKIAVKKAIEYYGDSNLTYKDVIEVLEEVCNELEEDNEDG